MPPTIFFPAVDLNAYFKVLRYFEETTDDGPEGWPLDETGDEKIKARDVGYQLFRAILMLEDHKEKTKPSFAIVGKHTGLDDGDEHPSYTAYNQESVSIEVMRMERIQKLHFPITTSAVLTEEMKVSVVRQVNRDSHNDKLRDFVRLSSIMVADVM